MQSECNKHTATIKPNTKKWHALLAKAWYTGDFFHFTRGGGVANLSNMLLVMEEKEMKKEAEKLEKKIVLLEKCNDIKEKARKVFW